MPEKCTSNASFACFTIHYQDMNQSWHAIAEDRCSGSMCSFITLQSTRALILQSVKFWSILDLSFLCFKSATLYFFTSAPPQNLLLLQRPISIQCNNRKTHTPSLTLRMTPNDSLNGFFTTLLKVLFLKHILCRFCAVHLKKLINFIRGFNVSATPNITSKRKD